MGGRWSLVQIQSPRPFLSPRRTLRVAARHSGPAPSMIEILGYWLAGGLVRWLPAPLIDRIGIAAARFTFALRPPARRALEANLARLLGAGSVARVPGVARESFEHFALSFADFL